MLTPTPGQLVRNTLRRDPGLSRVIKVDGDQAQVQDMDEAGNVIGVQWVELVHLVAVEK
jgi:hypothetical protein